MNRTVTVVCSPAAATGFAAAGISTRTCESPAAAASALAELSTGETGVVFIEDQLYETLPDTMRERRRAALPIIVPFPAPARVKAVSSLDYVVELLRRAIGYRVRLR